jgi:hypothetical protein
VERIINNKTFVFPDNFGEHILPNERNVVVDNTDASFFYKMKKNVQKKEMDLAKKLIYR